MAKRKTFFRKAKQLTIPVSIVAGFVPGIANVVAHRRGGAEEMAAEASRIYLGWAGTNRFGYNDTLGFHPYLLKFGTLPIIMGALAHKFIGGKLGVNRALQAAGVPFIRF